MTNLEKYQPSYKGKPQGPIRFILNGEFLVDFKENSLSLTTIKKSETNEGRSLRTGSPSFYFKSLGYNYINQLLRAQMLPITIKFSGDQVGRISLNHGKDIVESGSKYRNIKLLEISLSISENHMELGLKMLGGRQYSDSGASGESQSAEFLIKMDLDDVPMLLNQDEKTRQAVKAQVNA